MRKACLKAVGVAALMVSVSGCVGSNAVTGFVMKFNVEVVDNRYARAGVNFLLAPVYAISIAADALIFNSLEFWTGKNPINGKPHIFDSKTKTLYKINDDIDPSLRDAPVEPISLRQIDTGTMQAVDENTLLFAISYTNGDELLITGIRSQQQVSYYIDGVLVSRTTLSQLQELVASEG